MYVIYGYNTFNAAKVLLTAEELGIEYSYVPVNLGTGENLKPDHMARHPFGKIPVLEHNGEYLIESGSICRYLSRTNNNQLYSATPLGAARIDQMMDMVVQHVGRHIATYFWQEVIRVGLMKKAVEKEAIAEAAGFLNKQLPWFDALLANQTCLCGDSLTIADTIAFAYFHISENTSFSIAAYPNIQRWYASLAARPGFKKVYELIPPMGK